MLDRYRVGVATNSTPSTYCIDCVCVCVCVCVCACVCVCVCVCHQDGSVGPRGCWRRQQTWTPHTGVRSCLLMHTFLCTQGTCGVSVATPHRQQVSLLSRASALKLLQPSEPCNMALHCRHHPATTPLGVLCAGCQTGQPSRPVVLWCPVDRVP